MYDPTVGQFIEEDPIGFNDGDTNTYRYCGNSPTNGTDPSGEDEVDGGPTPELSLLAAQLPRFRGPSEADQQSIAAYEYYYGMTAQLRLNQLQAERHSTFDCLAGGDKALGASRVQALDILDAELLECKRYVLAKQGVGVLGASGGGTPVRGDSGSNFRTLSGTYFITSRATPRDKRMKPIPDVKKPSSTPPSGPPTGEFQIKAFPSATTGPVGGDGALTCIILVVKGPDNGFVAVFHFTAGDSAGNTLSQFSWPTGCQAIICGGAKSGDELGGSNCLADDVTAAANAAGLNIAGVSGSSGCGVNPDGSWYQTDY